MDLCRLRGSVPRRIALGLLTFMHGQLYLPCLGNRIRCDTEVTSPKINFVIYWRLGSR